MTRRPEITISKTDVLRYLEEAGACTRMLDAVRALDDEADIAEWYRGLDARDVVYFLEVMTSLIGWSKVWCFTPDCPGCVWCHKEGDSFVHATAIVAEWPFSRVLAALVGDA